MILESLHFSMIKALTGQVLTYFFKILLAQCLSVRWVRISVSPKAMMPRRIARMKDILI